MVQETERAWAAGFFEGEGSISPKKKRATVQTPNRLTVPQVALERLERLQKALGGVGSIHGPYIRSSKPYYAFEVGALDEVNQAISAMWPYLGPTTRSRIKELANVKGIKDR